MRWYGRKVLFVDSFIPAGERCVPPGRVDRRIGWENAQNHDRVVLRLDEDYVCAVAVSKIEQYARESQQLLLLARAVSDSHGGRDAS